MQNVHGKEIDLLRTTVKVPGKRPPRAVATVAPTASPKTNGLTKDRSTLQLGIGNTGQNPYFIICPMGRISALFSHKQLWYDRINNFRVLCHNMNDGITLFLPALRPLHLHHTALLYKEHKCEQSLIIWGAHSLLSFADFRFNILCLKTLYSLVMLMLMYQERHTLQFWYS